MLSTKQIKPFVLLSKEKGINLDTTRQYFPEMLSMLKAKTADVVEIGKRENPEQKIRITTFRNDKNEIIEMVHEYEGIEKPETHRLYRDLLHYGDITLKGRLVQIFENLDITGRFKAWQKIATEKQYVKSSLETREKTHVTIAKVSTDERTIKPIVHEHHSLTEYYVPKAHGGKKIQPKYIEFETETQNGIPQVTRISASKDVNIPQHDEYLGMRMYDSDDIREPITRSALKDSRLDAVDIPIEDSFSIKKSTSGCFDETVGKILFNNRYQEKVDVIETGFHEGEHAYQYSVLGITGKLKTAYGQRCKDKLNWEITPALRHEAVMYELGHKNYVQPEVNYDEYRKNILEDYAWEAGETGLTYYLRKGKELSSQFPGIPAKEL